MSFSGVDISAFNGNVNFDVIKSSGYNFVMLRAGGSDDGFYTDIWFKENYNKAKRAGLHVGAYYIVGKRCITAADGEADAKRFINIVNGMKFDYPLAMDCELTSYNDKDGATDAAIAFCKELEKAGYYAMIYGSDDDTFKYRLDYSRLNEFDLWVAKWSGFPSFVPKERVGIWQSSSNGTIANHTCKFDMDISYRNYPEIIADMNKSDAEIFWEEIKKYAEKILKGEI